jgi:predicted nucleotidyltransferase
MPLDLSVSGTLRAMVHQDHSVSARKSEVHRLRGDKVGIAGDEK